MQWVKDNRSIAEAYFYGWAKAALLEGMKDKNESNDFLYMTGENSKEQIRGFLDVFIIIYEKLQIYKNGKIPRPDDEIMLFYERYKIAIKFLEDKKSGMKFSGDAIKEITDLVRVES